MLLHPHRVGRRGKRGRLADPVGPAFGRVRAASRFSCRGRKKSGRWPMASWRANPYGCRRRERGCASGTNQAQGEEERCSTERLLSYPLSSGC